MTHKRFVKLCMARFTEVHEYMKKSGMPNRYERHLYKPDNEYWRMEHFIKSGSKEKSYQEIYDFLNSFYKEIAE